MVRLHVNSVVTGGVRVCVLVPGTPRSADREAWSGTLKSDSLPSCCTPGHLWRVLEFVGFLS